MKALNISTPLPVEVHPLRIDANRSIFVLRDDLLPAGTKQRAIIPLLQDFIGAGYTHMTYASPFAGFAQVALAYGCHSLGIQCTIFCERDPGQAGQQAHAFTRLAESWGAKIILTEDLAQAEAAASATEKPGLMKIPLGFHCREFHQHFHESVAEVLGSVRAQIGRMPRRAWLPIGSGTLTQAFHKSAPSSMRISCVDVHVLDERDLRIQAVRAISRVTFYSALEKFREQAFVPPPLPSNIHYDAKIWNFVSRYAADGDLWWNVAR